MIPLRDLVNSEVVLGGLTFYPAIDPLGRLLVARDADGLIVNARDGAPRIFDNYAMAARFAR